MAFQTQRQPHAAHLKMPLQYSWRAASLMLGGELRRESGRGGRGTVGRGFTVLVCTSDSDDGMVKNSGMASCENKSHQGPRLGGENVCVCGTLRSRVRIKVPMLPVKNDITPTEGRLAEVFFYSFSNTSHASVFPRLQSLRECEWIFINELWE